ncbi:MFS transporter [Devosia sp. YIM 151766]|uniref:MFS transporter n=1 Tax=Devosia sp. YIM 151766 TaxID=3017325 RepID=UPI00255C7342|nr:MFS transporter [Devosia sp. YIM 151766]WIY53829.1 MFS transporter [Devosia sp. YIM 151766]
MTAPKRLPVTALLGANMFFSGVTYAATMPYASVVGVETLGMSPGWFASVMAAGSVLGTLVSLSLGFISDKLPDRRLLVLVTAMAGIVAHGMIYAWPDQWSFALAMALVMPIAGACYSQCFGYVRVYYLKHMPERADFMVTALRTVFTIAWIVVPPLAGWVAAEFSIFNVYLVSSLSYAAIGGIFALLMADKATAAQMPAPVRAEGASLLSSFALPLGTLAGLLGLVVMTAAMRILTFTVPLFIVTDLGGTVADIGYYAGITAAVEAPCMLLLAYLTTRLSKETLLAAAGLVMAAFIGLTSILTSMSAFYWLLILNGLGTAALMSVNISYVQDAIKGRVGLSTSLMDVVAIAANLLGATAFGLLTTSGDYRFALAVGAGVSVLGAAIMAGGNWRRLGGLQAASA